MRALILVATAALALSACSKQEAADNTMNVDETMTTNEVLANDTAIDMNAVDANMTTDVNATTTVDANATTTTDANTTNAQ